MLGAFAALLVTLGCLGLSVWLLKRIGPGARGGAGGLPLTILRRIGTGPKQGVALLQVGERVLVVSVSDRGTELLTELDGPDLQAALLGATPVPAQSAAAPGEPFSVPALVRRLRVISLVVGLLTLAPALSGSGFPAGALAGAFDGGTLQAQTVQGPLAPKVSLTIGQGAESLQLSGAVGIVVFMGAMTLLPAVFLLMTSFTRILVVLHFVRTGIGTQTAPPGQLLVALAVLLTGVVMQPVMERANTTALQPYLNGQLSQVEAYKNAVSPLREFMLANTREKDLGTFAQLTGQEDADSLEALPTLTITAAFVTSELRTAFQMGFVIFLPFVVVDLIVASVLMSMGMFMLPPVMISLPFKLMLFVLADGWNLVVQRLVTGFQV
jgi:flagellar biosynthetic protein FliP